MIHYITALGVADAWVVTELTAVEREAIPFKLHALRAPQQHFFKSDWVATLNEETRAIYPLRFSAAALSILRAPFRYRGRFFRALLNGFFGPRESVRARIAALAHLGVACHWADSLRGEDVSHIHSQWIHSAGTVGMYGAQLLGVSFSFTGHAADLFRERVALKDKIRQAEFIVCISTFHRDFFLKEGAREDQLFIAYCGIDPAHFTPKPIPPRAGRAFQIRASGRLVEKKGFTYLIDACKLLVDRGEDIQCRIGGSGPLEESLRSQVERLGLSDRITLTGDMLKQEDIPEFMYGGDVFCLPCVWSSDNDVDGLPQMLMEAMACGLPVISTRLVGIPDLVVHEETGLLVEANDAAQLGDAIQRVIREEEFAKQLATAGRTCIEETFDIHSTLTTLINTYRDILGIEADETAPKVLS